MVDITKLLESELRNDLADSLTDIKVCELALLHRIDGYSGGSVQNRLDTNRGIVKVIEAELERRGKEED